MIVFDLSCRNGHRFEGWFGSSADFAEQQERGLLSCPQCGCEEIAKAPMAPAVPAKGNQRAEVPAMPFPSGQSAQGMANGAFPPEVQQALVRLAEAQARALKNSRWVGRRFAEDVRAMHYGERDVEPIHGEATPEEAKGLLEEGIEVVPLPFPVAPPKSLN
ncbi:MAG: DUF1178 family protein [Alteraurantiacibacter sp.]|nr:DUF1178 family protein [Alteraurantiacibacter sp.]